MTGKSSTLSKLEQVCLEKGLKMTGQRRVIAQIISKASKSHDHLDVEEVYERASAVDEKISIATVYRTMRLFEEAGIVSKLELGDGRARYEEASDEHHDHLIDIKSGKIIEFYDEKLEQLKEAIAKKLGYKLVGHRLELYAVPEEKK